MAAVDVTLVAGAEVRAPRGPLPFDCRQEEQTEGQQIHVVVGHSERGEERRGEERRGEERRGEERRGEERRGRIE